MRRDAKRILNFSSGKIDWILNGENGTVGHKENVEGFVIV
jgi:hypothetical protein